MKEVLNEKIVNEMQNMCIDRIKEINAKCRKTFQEEIDAETYKAIYNLLYNCYNKKIEIKL